MSHTLPPVPPAGRSPKGPGGTLTVEASRSGGGDRHPPENLAEQDRQGNIKQNTTHQAYQQNR
jgi:hypothetical protein